MSAVNAPVISVIDLTSEPDEESSGQQQQLISQTEEIYQEELDNKLKPSTHPNTIQPQSIIPSSTSSVPSTSSIPTTSSVPSTSSIPTTSSVPSTSSIPTTSSVPSTSPIPTTSSSSSSSASGLKRISVRVKRKPRRENMFVYPNLMTTTLNGLVAEASLSNVQKDHRNTSDSMYPPSSANNHDTTPENLNTGSNGTENKSSNHHEKNLVDPAARNTKRVQHKSVTTKIPHLIDNDKTKSKTILNSVYSYSPLTWGYNRISIVDTNRLEGTQQSDKKVLVVIDLPTNIPSSNSSDVNIYPDKAQGKVPSDWSTTVDVTRVTRTRKRSREEHGGSRSSKNQSSELNETIKKKKGKDHADNSESSKKRGQSIKKRKIPTGTNVKSSTSQEQELNLSNNSSSKNATKTRSKGSRDQVVQNPSIGTAEDPDSQQKERKKGSSNRQRDRTKKAVYDRGSQDSANTDSAVAVKVRNKASVRNRTKKHANAAKEEREIGEQIYSTKSKTKSGNNKRAGGGGGGGGGGGVGGRKKDNTKRQKKLPTIGTRIASSSSSYETSSLSALPLPNDEPSSSPSSVSSDSPILHSTNDDTEMNHNNSKSKVSHMNQLAHSDPPKLSTKHSSLSSALPPFLFSQGSEEHRLAKLGVLYPSGLTPQQNFIPHTHHILPLNHPAIKGAKPILQPSDNLPTEEKSARPIQHSSDWTRGLREKSATLNTKNLQSSALITHLWSERQWLKDRLNTVEALLAAETRVNETRGQLQTFMKGFERSSSARSDSDSEG